MRGGGQGSDGAAEGRAVSLFLFLVVLLAWLPSGIALLRSERASPLWFWATAAAPLVASAAAGLLTGEPLPWRFRLRAPARWLVASLLLPAAWVAAVILLGTVTRLTAWPAHGETLRSSLGHAATSLLFPGLPLALLQEAGWRGFLLPRLLPRGRIPAALLTSVAWTAAWAPWLLLEDYYGKLPAGLGPAALALQLLLLSLVMTWLYSGSRGSLAVSVLAHAMFWSFAGGMTGPGFLEGMPILGSARGVLGSMFLVVGAWLLYVIGGFDEDRREPAG
jgi:hypothetical protein